MKKIRSGVIDVLEEKGRKSVVGRRVLGGNQPWSICVRMIDRKTMPRAGNGE